MTTTKINETATVPATPEAVREMLWWMSLFTRDEQAEFVAKPMAIAESLKPAA